MTKIRWKCTVCGYIHEGDTPPDTCPICGVESTLFERMDESVTAVEQTPPVPTSSPDIQHGIKPALFKISYGLFIISAIDRHKLNGQCANTVFQITSEPATVAIGINKQNYTHQFIEASGLVGISILGKQGHNLVRKFGYQSGRNTDKFSDVSYRIGASGVPILNDAIAFLEGKVVNKMDCGTHSLFLLDITEGDLTVNAEPMTYAYFRATK